VLYDPLLPREAGDEDNWEEQEVTVRALRDTHLVGATVPVAFERYVDATYYPGVAYVGGQLRRDQTYKVWSYIKQPTPKQLIRSRPNYPDEIHIGEFLGTGFGSVPPFGTPGRNAAMRELFSDDVAGLYEPLYDTALEVVGRPRNPYAAVVALEAWFRTGGDFRYDERPPIDRMRPPLVAFVEDHRRGYCQHFAGAMALMLRYLGIPARIGAGFTSGRYDVDDREWTVSDKNAHTWVEVWFEGYGWLPFDPTPGRGRLAGSYTASSFTFDVSGATGAFAGGATALGLDILRSRFGDRNAANDDRFRGLSPQGGVDDEAATSGSNDGGAGDSLIGLLLLIGVALTGGLWVVKLGRRSLRYLTHDPRQLAGAVRLDLVDYLLDQRVPVSASATPAELGTQLEQKIGVVGDRLALALAEARYGPGEEAPAAAEYARRELRAVRRRMRRRLGTWARLRGLLSLRSLGFGSA
jgi:transglutaminase-like putative cysteine protease